MPKYLYKGKEAAEVEYIGMWKPWEIKDIPEDMNYRVIGIGRPDLFELQKEAPAKLEKFEGGKK